MRLSSVITALLLLLSAAAARGEVEWLSKEYNFGAFKEAEGSVTGSVRLVNHGPDATFISRVRPSCGCTGASYTTNMIEPGDTATVSFTYNPQGRPGPFDKTVKVFMGEENELTVIRIMGTVIGSASTLQSHFPVECGSLRLDNTLLATGDIKRGQNRHLFMNVYNQGENPIKPVLYSPAKALNVELTPEVIKPGELGTLTFYFCSSLEPADGPYDYPVIIKADGEDSEEVTVTLSAVIVPDTRAIPLEELEQAPQAFLLPEFVEAGEGIGNDDVEFEFSVLNEGKNPLEINKVFSRDGSIDITRVPESVKSGDKGLVKGKLRVSKIKEGPFRLKVEVLTNDPLHPVRTCNIVGIKGTTNQ